MRATNLVEANHYEMEKGNTIMSNTMYLVTGAAGFLGSTICRQLVERGDKVRGLVSQAASPIADSFYPYLLRTKDFRKMFRVTFLLEVLILLVCVVLWVYSEEFCVIVFGTEFRSTADILRHMIPLMSIVLPSYMFGFPALTPIGKAKWANLSVQIALINQIIGMIVLFALGKISAISLINLTFMSECISFIIRVVVFISGKNNSRVSV